MWEYNYVDELYHHGVKGMKWGVRKARQAESDLRDKKAAYKKAKKAANKSFMKADTYSLAAWSPSKKHRANNDKRWADYAKKATAADKAKAEYKSAKKEFNKNTTVGQKIGAALRSDGAKTAAKGASLAASGAKVAAQLASKMAMWSITDDLFYGGAGKKIAKSVAVNTGRAAVTAFVMARGGHDIKWYDKYGRRVG